MKDLFEFYKEQPQKLKEVCEKWIKKSGDGFSYQDCEDFLEDVEKIGFTFEYDFDAEPYDLRPMTKKEVLTRQIVEFEKTDRDLTAYRNLFLKVVSVTRQERGLTWDLVDECIGDAILKTDL